MSRGSGSSSGGEPNEPTPTSLMFHRVTFWKPDTYIYRLNIFLSRGLKVQDVIQGSERTSNTHADQLNQQCYCITLDREALTESLRAQFLSAESELSAVPELHHLFQTPRFSFPALISRRWSVLFRRSNQLPRFRLIRNASCLGRRKLRASILAP